MNKIICGVLVLNLFAISSVKAGDLGLGAAIGNPTGVTAKYWLNNQNAIDGVIGWHLYDGSFQLHTDYLWHRFDVFKKSSFRMDLHFGAGLRLVSPYGKFGFRAPVGLSHEFKKPDIEAFVELAPILNLAPGTSVDLDFLIGARYYF